MANSFDRKKENVFCSVIVGFFFTLYVFTVIFHALSFIFIPPSCILNFISISFFCCFYFLLFYPTVLHLLFHFLPSSIHSSMAMISLSFIFLRSIFTIYRCGVHALTFIFYYSSFVYSQLASLSFLFFFFFVFFTLYNVLLYLSFSRLSIHFL